MITKNQENFKLKSTLFSAAIDCSYFLHLNSKNHLNSEINCSFLNKYDILAHDFLQSTSCIMYEDSLVVNIFFSYPFLSCIRFDKWNIHKTWTIVRGLDHTSFQTLCESWRKDQMSGQLWNRVEPENEKGSIFQMKWQKGVVYSWADIISNLQIAGKSTILNNKYRMVMIWAQWYFDTCMRWYTTHIWMNTYIHELLFDFNVKMSYITFRYTDCDDVWMIIVLLNHFRNDSTGLRNKTRKYIFSFYIWLNGW